MQLKKKVLPIIFIVLIFFGIIVSAQPTLNGKVKVSFSVPISSIDTSEFAALIEYAETLKRNTHISTNGAGISANEYWATPPAHSAFQIAIDTANIALERFNNAKIIGPLAPGESFKMTLAINDNTGFANMSASLFIPQGLEITHIELGSDVDLINGFIPPPGYNSETGEITPLIGPNNSFVIWGGRVNNFTQANANLLTYTFRVSDNAATGTTAPITFDLADRHGQTRPSDSDGNPLNITLPGNNGEIGMVAINGTQQSYALNIQNNPQAVTPIGQTLSAQRRADSTINLLSGTQNGYIFSQWSSDNVNITNAGSATSASFTMPNNAVTVTANWLPIAETGVLYTTPISSEPFATGDSFNVTVRIRNNPSFANMSLRLYVPEWLELTHVAVGSELSLESGFIPPSGHSSETGEITPVIGSAHSVTLWGGRVSNFHVPDTDLLTYTFKIADNAPTGKTDSISISFADSLGFTIPTDVDGNPVAITIANNGEVGGVLIE